VSTIKSSAEDLTINADGSNEIKFQINAVEKASIDSSGAFTSTTIDATALTGNLPALNASSLTSIPAANITGTLPAIDGSNLTGLSSGLSSASTFRLQADHSTNADITNWAEASAEGYGRLGTAVSETAGVFSFPSTGIWFIAAQITFHGNTNDQNTVNLQVTLNDSAYGSESYCTSTDIDGNVNNTYPMTVLVDVTDTSNVKVKFTASSLNTGSFLWGSADSNYTSATFIKLGET
jgi:hypothetical protein